MNDAIRLLNKGQEWTLADAARANVYPRFQALPWPHRVYLVLLKDFPGHFERNTDPVKLRT